MVLRCDVFPHLAESPTLDAADNAIQIQLLTDKSTPHKTEEAAVEQRPQKHQRASKEPEGSQKVIAYRISKSRSWVSKFCLAPLYIESGSTGLFPVYCMACHAVVLAAFNPESQALI